MPCHNFYMVCIFRCSSKSGAQFTKTVSYVEVYVRLQPIRVDVISLSIHLTEHFYNGRHPPLYVAATVHLLIHAFNRILGGCPFNGPLSVMKYPARESPRRDVASPIK